MDQSSSKGKINNLKHQLLKGNITTALLNKTLKTQSMELNEKTSALLQTAVKTQRENNQLKQEISSKFEHKRYKSKNRRKDQSKELLSEKYIKLLILQKQRKLSKKQSQFKKLKKQKKKTLKQIESIILYSRRQDLQKKIVLRTGTTLINNRSKQYNIEKEFLKKLKAEYCSESKKRIET